jgi:hypothetical protein
MWVFGALFEPLIIRGRVHRKPAEHSACQILGLVLELSFVHCAESFRPLGEPDISGSLRNVGL